MLLGLQNLKVNLEHRRQIAAIYNSMLPKKVLLDIPSKQIEFSANLRFPIFAENREDIIKFLKGNGVYVSDIWYDDVSPDCPNAQTAASQILNLPTHINVSENDAKQIAQKINQWLQ